LNEGQMLSALGRIFDTLRRSLISA
jgi:hypothetical protein